MTKKLHFISMRVIVLARASITSAQFAEDLRTLSQKYSASKYDKKRHQATANIKVITL